MRAAIVGAAGLLGTVLCHHLQRRGWEVFGYDVAAADEPVEGVRYSALDVLREDVRFPRGADAVFYLAQSPRYRDFPRSADHLFGVNTYGAIKAAQAAIEAEARWFCFASTGSVYAQSLGPLAETNPVRHDQPYALSKLQAEAALALFAPQMPVLSVRLFGLFGQGQKQMLPATLLSQIQSGQPIFVEPVPGDVGPPEGLSVSFTYVEDAAGILEQLACAALARTPLPPVLNLAGPEAVSVRRFAETIGGILGIRPEFVRAPTPLQRNLIADLRLLRTIVSPIHTPFSEAMTQSYTLVQK